MFRPMRRHKQLLLEEECRAILENATSGVLAVLLLAQKYAPDTSADHKEQAIQREIAPLCMLEMTIEHMTGKQAIELIK